MPLSLEDQLKLMNPKLFEELCAQIIKKEYPDSYRVDGVGGDEGIDIFSGELDVSKRQREGTTLKVWQVKYFPNGISSPQIKKIKESFKRVMEKNMPDFWTLCIPVNLTIPIHKTLNTIKSEFANNVEISLLQGDQIISKVREDASIKETYFLHTESGKCFLHHLEDFESVHEIVQRIEKKIESGGVLKDATNYYNGFIPVWSDIIQGFDAPREKYAELWTSVVRASHNKGGTIPFILLTGQSGEGKSTLLMRLAVQLTKYGAPNVFYYKDDKETLNAEQFLTISNNDTIYIIIDKVSRIDTEKLRGFITRMYRESIPAVVIGADITSLCEGLELNSLLENSAQIHWLQMGSVTKRDLVELSNKWKSINGGTEELKQLSQERLKSIFRRQSERQLLVTLLEIKHNKKFASYISDELRSIEKHFSENWMQIKLTLLYVSALFRLDITMPYELLKQLLSIEFIDTDVLQFTKGLMFEVSKGFNIEIRHSLIADVVFRRLSNSENYQLNREGQNIYSNIINFAGSEHQIVIGKMIRLLNLRGEIGIQSSLFKIAHEKFKNNIIILHMYAMNVKFAGEIKKARELFRKGTESDPKNAPLWQAWSLMEKEQGEIEKARELFGKGTENDPKHAPLWQAWAIMEKEQGKIEKARELFGKGTENDPNNAPLWQAWAILEKEQGEIEKGRELFLKGTENDPNNAPLWQAWALMEKEQGEIEKARELFGKGTESDPKHAPLWQAWALLEKEQGEIKKARELFGKGTENDPKHAPLWQAWAIMEKEQGEIEKARELFGKGTENDPKHAPLWQAWAIMEKEQGEIAKARELFSKGTENDPKNAPLWQDWAIMEKEIGEIEKARELFLQGTENDPNDAPLLNAWAIMEKKLGNIAKAETLFLSSVENEKDSVSIARTFFDLATMFRYSKREQYLLMSVQHNSRDHITHANLGKYYGYQGNWEKSEEHFKLALQLKPNDTKTQDWYRKMKIAKDNFNKKTRTHFE